jgi:hypothetical protein
LPRSRDHQPERRGCSGSASISPPPRLLVSLGSSCAGAGFGVSEAGASSKFTMGAASRTVERRLAGAGELDGAGSLAGADVVSAAGEDDSKDAAPFCSGMPSASKSLPD